MHGQIWQYFDTEDYVLPEAKPFTLAAYCAGELPDAYVTHLAVGELLPQMPLFLSAGAYVNVPFAAAYDAAWRGVPAYWRAMMEEAERRSP